VLTLDFFTPYSVSVNQTLSVGFEVLTAVSTKMAVFWVVAPCVLVEVYQRFSGIALMMEAARTSETLVNFYQNTRRYNPDDSHLPNTFSSTTGDGQ
jgi:hypothetical protein